MDDLKRQVAELVLGAISLLLGAVVFWVRAKLAESLREKDALAEINQQQIQRALEQPQHHPAEAQAAAAHTMEAAKHVAKVRATKRLGGAQ